MLNYLPVAKLAGQVVAGLGVSKILSDVIKNNVRVVTTADAVKVWVGSFVLGSMIVEQATNHVERATDEAVAMLKSFKAEKETEK